MNVFHEERKKNECESQIPNPLEGEVKIMEKEVETVTPTQFVNKCVSPL